MFFAQTVRMGEGVAQQEKKPGLWASLTSPPPPGWRPRTIALAGGTIGLLGAIIGWQMQATPSLAMGWGLGMSMVLGPYYVVPRAKTQRRWQGFIGGALAGVVAALGMFALAPARFVPDWTQMLTDFVVFLAAAFGSSWLFTLFTDWVDRRRDKMPTPKFGAPKLGKRAEPPPRPPRVHHNKRKKKRR